MRRLLYKTVLIASVLSLAGCATVDSVHHSMRSWLHQDKPKQIHLVRSGMSAEQYLQLAATSPAPQQEYYQLLAVEKLILENKLTRAAQVLATVNTYNMPNDITVKKQLLFAKVQLADQKPDLALRALSDVPLAQNINQNDQRSLHQTLATSYEKTGNIVASIEQRNLLDPLLPTRDAKQKNQLKIWETVQHLPADQINILLAEPLAPDIRGWLALAQLAQQASTHPEALFKQLDQWKQAYPTHSGNQLLPKRVDARTRALAKSPHQIYLLLPLHGKYAKNGQAVRNGFMAAFYDSKKTQHTHTAINIIDTSNADITTAYQTAVNKGADFIIGPLTKSKIKELALSTRLTVPTLALNYIPTLHQPNLYQFGLSQFDEAEQVANHASEAGYHRAIVIAPATAWGQTIADRFKNVWRQDGHEIVGSLAYKSSNDLSKPIRNLLQVNKSENRGRALQKVLREDVRAIPNRRDDVDMIFLVAQSQQARSIRPMLKFYYAGNLPVYATSLVYEPSLSTQKNRDLDQLHFSDMPWVIGGLSKRLKHIQDKAKKLWTKSFAKETKFYALGVDAHELTMNLSQLAIFPHYSIQGATGALSLKEDNHVFRRLPWAEMKNGRPQRLG